MDGYENLAAILKTLGHPVRLQIVEELRREGEACVCHLEHALGQRQAYISQHLARLREAGLVTDRRDGMNVFYALVDGSLGSLLDTAVESAQAIARLEGRKITFRHPSPGGWETCPCPKCQEKAAALIPVERILTGE